MVTICYRWEWKQEGSSRTCQAVWAAVLKVLAIIFKISLFSSPRGRKGQGPARAVTVMLGAMSPCHQGQFGMKIWQSGPHRDVEVLTHTYIYSHLDVKRSTRNNNGSCQTDINNNNHKSGWVRMCLLIICTQLCSCISPEVELIYWTCSKYQNLGFGRLTGSQDMWD